MEEGGKKRARKPKSLHTVIFHWCSDVPFRPLSPFKRIDVQLMTSDASNKLESLETESQDLCLLKSD